MNRRYPVVFDCMLRAGETVSISQEPVLRELVGHVFRGEKLVTVKDGSGTDFRVMSIQSGGVEQLPKESLPDGVDSSAFASNDLCSEMLFDDCGHGEKIVITFKNAGSTNQSVRMIMFGRLLDSKKP